MRGVLYAPKMPRGGPTPHVRSPIPTRSLRTCQSLWDKGGRLHKVPAVPEVKHRCETWLKTYQKIVASCTADHDFFVLRDIYGKELRPVPKTPSRKAGPGPKVPKGGAKSQGPPKLPGPGKTGAATRKTTKAGCTKQVKFDDACNSPDPKRHTGSEQVEHADIAATAARKAMAGMDATVEVISNPNPNPNPALP